MKRKKFIETTALSSLTFMMGPGFHPFIGGGNSIHIPKKGFLRLEIEASNLMAQHKFYSNVLGLNCFFKRGELKVFTGTTEILFKESALKPSPFYHIAWGIPGNRLQEAKKWLRQRTALLCDSYGRDEFFFTPINRTGVYFKDPAGNILEFICLHDLGEYDDKNNFDVDDILFVNHVGIAVKDVFKEIEGIKNHLSMQYLGNLTKDFSKIGNDYEHITLVSENRLWIPERKEPAQIFPMKIFLPSNIKKKYVIKDYPYQIMLG